MAATKRRYVAIAVALLLIVGIPGYLTMYTSPDPDYSEPQADETTGEREAGEPAPPLVFPEPRRSAPQDPATMPPGAAVAEADVPTHQEPGAEPGVSQYVGDCRPAAEMQIPDADSRDVTLKIATAAPEPSYFVQRLREAAALVKTQTAGRVSIKLYPGGVMGPDHQVFKKMGRDGWILQGAVLSSATLDQVAAELGIYRLPLLFRSADEVAHVRGVIDPQLHEALRERCFVSFHFAGNGFSHLFSRLPVRAEQDLEGKNIWNPWDRVSYRFFEPLSVTPSLVPLIDVMVSLQTQQLDVVPASPPAVLLLQWHNYLDYMTDLPLSYSYNVLVINAWSFGRVTPRDQQIVAAALNAAMDDLDTASFPSYREALQTLTERGYVQRVPVDPTFHVRLETRAHEMTMWMIANGVLPKDLTLQVLQVLEDYRAAAP